MPEVYVYAVEGRTIEQKRSLVKDITDAVVKNFKVPADAAFVHLPELLALARHPNIAVKATGGPGYADDTLPFKSLQPRYRAIYDAFGPQRMFWGTDITRMPCSWKECVTHFTEHSPWLSQPDMELIMGRALCEWIDWKLPTR